MPAPTAAVPARELRPGLLLGVALVVVALAYSSALEVGFVWDDHPLIEQQPLVQELRPLPDYFSRQFWSDPLATERRNFYRPLTTFSYALDRAVGGGGPFAFHLTNLLLHLGCCALVFALARRAGASAPSAALGAALFGTFPRLTESVTWISGRTDLLGGFGALAALLVHRSEPERVGRRVLAAALLLAGLLCKEVAAAGLVGIVVLELAESRQTRAGLGRVARNLLPVGLASVIYAALRLPATLGQEAATLLPIEGAARVSLILESVGWYATMLVDGWRPRLQIGLLGDPRPLLALLGAAVLVAAAVLGRRAVRRWSPFPLALAALGVSALLLVIHLVRLAIVVAAADRFLYVPAAILAVGVAVWASRRVLVGVLLAALIASYAVAVRARNEAWSSEIGLWREAIRTTSPLSRYTHGNLADALFDRRLLDAALAEYRTALRIARDLDAHGLEDRQTVLSVAVTLGLLARYGEADELFQRLLRDYPDWKRLRLSYVMLLARQLRFDAAEAELATAARLLGNDALAAQIRGQLAAARAEFSALPAEQADEPPGVTARRAVAFDRLGAVGEARRLWRRVVEHPSAAVYDVRRGAGYLTLNGELEEGRRALGRLASRAGDDPVLEELARLLEERRRDAGVEPPATAGL